jgi:hypothetical protein
LKYIIEGLFTVSSSVPASFNVKKKEAAVKAAKEGSGGTKKVEREGVGKSREDLRDISGGVKDIGGSGGNSRRKNSGNNEYISVGANSKSQTSQRVDIAI